MKELLLVEKSSTSIGKTSDPYTLEGMFTELGEENRNGRIYTKDGFLPHLTQLQKVVEQGKAVGELDHPKVFETSLKNSSHVIEKIWFDEKDNKVYGRIKLLDTDAGKNAKALVDAGVPLHISSRAAGTVTEDKSVKIHKLFTYDLVADPGFENAVLNTVNESYGIENAKSSNFFMYEVAESKLSKKPVIDNQKFISEDDLNGFTKYTKETIDSLKENLDKLQKAQNAIIKQNDEIADNINSNVLQESINLINDKIKGIEDWSNHVVEEFTTIKSESDRIKVLEDKLTGIENWSEHVTETVSGIENWSEHVTETVSGIEDWSEHVTETVTAIEDWSDEATTTVSGIENWSEHVTETVSGIEDWSEHVTETVTGIEKWSDEATDVVTKLEEGALTENPIKRKKKVDVSLSETYITGLYKKIDSIIDDAKKQKAEEKQELVKEENEFNKTEEPFWKSMMPGKYTELWEALSESKKSSIVKRATICEFLTESSVTEFWNATFANTTIEMIKESSKMPVQKTAEEVENAIAARRLRIVEGYNKNFKTNH